MSLLVFYRQPDPVYVAVIPVFIEALRDGKQPVIRGDGGQSRAFTYIDDVVAGNVAASVAPAEVCAGRYTTSLTRRATACSSSSRS